MVSFVFIFRSRRTTITVRNVILPGFLPPMLEVKLLWICLELLGIIEALLGVRSKMVGGGNQLENPAATYFWYLRFLCLAFQHNQERIGNPAASGG
jgi:hypothetical protein